MPQLMMDELFGSLSKCRDLDLRDQKSYHKMIRSSTERDSCNQNHREIEYMNIFIPSSLRTSTFNFSNLKLTHKSPSIVLIKVRMINSIQSSKERLRIPKMTKKLSRHFVWIKTSSADQAGADCNSRLSLGQRCSAGIQILSHLCRVILQNSGIFSGSTADKSRL